VAKPYSVWTMHLHKMFTISDYF